MRCGGPYGHHDGRYRCTGIDPCTHRGRGSEHNGVGPGGGRYISGRRLHGNRSVCHYRGDLPAHCREPVSQYGAGISRLGQQNPPRRHGGKRFQEPFGYGSVRYQRHSVAEASEGRGRPRTHRSHGNGTPQWAIQGSIYGDCAVRRRDGNPVVALRSVVQRGSQRGSAVFGPHHGNQRHHHWLPTHGRDPLHQRARLIRGTGDHHTLHRNKSAPPAANNDSARSAPRRTTSLPTNDCRNTVTPSNEAMSPLSVH